jgi:hypothetical protein
MSKININEILSKYQPQSSVNSIALSQAALVGEIDYKPAIKEIIDAVIDKCAEEATVCLVTYTQTHIVHDKSILQVKDMIDYD